MDDELSRDTPLGDLVGGLLDGDLLEFREQTCLGRELELALQPVLRADWGLTLRDWGVLFTGNLLVILETALATGITGDLYLWLHLSCSDNDTPNLNEISDFFGLEFSQRQDLLLSGTRFYKIQLKSSRQ